MEKFYITTPIYYANASPHIGHAYTTIKADCLARWKRNLECKVFFSAGMDEHGLKIQRQAENAKENPQEFVDKISKEFQDLWRALDISYDGFIRTSDSAHKKAVEETLDFLYKNGAIYKGIYKGLYCVGCEQFIPEAQLIGGKCPDHDKEPEKLEEESYMLKMSEWQDKLAEEVESDRFKIIPEKRKNEVLSFLRKQKLEDISISRKNVSRGIPLPFDKEHSTYVWVDAFLNYLTVLGWGGGDKNTPEFFPPDIQLVGKDILRVHSTIWPVILLHLNIPLPRELYVHGYILSEGRKMSKTLGNVVDPKKLLEEYGKDAVRYYLMRHMPSFEDGEITYDRFKEVYNADLANGLGNLTSRIIKMSESYLVESSSSHLAAKPPSEDMEFEKLINSLEFNRALDLIWKKIADLDLRIQETQPFKLIKEDADKAKEIVRELVYGLYEISVLLEPFMPEASEKIKRAIEANKIPEPLFLRKD